MNKEEPTLLSHFQDIRGELSREGGISIVIYCGKVKSEGDLSAGMALHRGIVEDEVNKEEVNVTGILIGQGLCVLHLIEAPCNSVLRILTQLSTHPQYISQGQSGRIIYSLEDKPQRCFPEWYSSVIQDIKSPVDDVNEETCLPVIHDLATKLLDVGIALQSEAHSDIEFQKYVDSLPGKNLLVSLAQSELFFPLEEFVECYCESFNLQLESENVWPLERLVEY